MPIIVNLDVMLAKRKRRLNELSEYVGVSAQNLSILKTGKARAVRFSTLEAICKFLECQPGDILEYREGGAEEAEPLLAPIDDAAWEILRSPKEPM
jgi:putative transcriptional regulator